MTSKPASAFLVKMDAFKSTPLFFLLVVAIAQCKDTIGKHLVSLMKSIGKVCCLFRLANEWLRLECHTRDWKLSNRFCRIYGADDLYLEDGGGVPVGVPWINDVLVSPFKYMGVFHIASLRMRGDILEEELITTDGNPTEENIMVSVQPNRIHSKRTRKLSM